MHSFGLRLATFILVAQQQIVNGFVPHHSISNNNHHHGIIKKQHRQLYSASLEGDVVSAEEDRKKRSGGVGVVPDMVAYASGYTTAKELPVAVCEAVEGQIPNDLVGTYYRSGPAMFSAGSLIPPKASIVQPKQPPTADGVDADRMVLHPFDGDGGILGVTFHNSDDDDDGESTTTNAATARFRFVRTNAFTNERRKGMRLYTGMDNTRRSTKNNSLQQIGNDVPLPMYRHHFQSGLNKKRKNTSNTRSIYWSKKLLTLWEGGLPYKLDALGLSTEGRSQLGGVLLESSPFGSKAVMDPKTNTLLMYSNLQDPSKSTLTLYEFNSKFRLISGAGGGGAEDGKVTQELPGFAIVSDFAATNNYAIFVQPTTTVNAMQYNILNKDPGQSVQVNANAPSMLHLIPRATTTSNKKGMKTIALPFDGGSDAELQFINAFEETDNTIIFDAIRSDGRNISKVNTKWPWAQSLKEYEATASKKSLWRYTVNVSSGSVTKQCLSSLQTSFATVNPQYNMQSNYQYIYTCVGGMGDNVAPPQGIAKFDVSSSSSTTTTKISNENVDMWFPKEYEFCGEPMFAPKKKKTSDNNNNNNNNNNEEEVKEDDGYIISIMYNGKTKESSVLIFNAQQISVGPIARIPLGISVPHGLYGCFTATEEAGWTEDEISRRAKLSDKMESRGNMWNEVKSDFSGLGLRLDDFEEYFGDIL